MGEERREGRVVVVRGRIGYLRWVSPEELMEVARRLGRKGEGEAEGEGKRS